MDGNSTVPATSGHAVEIHDAAQFEELVIKASQSRVVMVDFWANWCAPCHMLAPVLDKLAREMGDAVSLVKVETDSEPELASRYQIRSLPTVMIFKNGAVVDQFMGAQSEAEIRKILSTHVTTEADLLVSEAESELGAGNTTKAMELLTAALEKDPGRDQVRLQLAGLLVTQELYDSAQQVLEPVGDDIRHSSDYKALHASIELARQTQTDEPIDLEQLAQSIAAKPDDCGARYQLALGFLKRHQFSEALDQLLEIVKRDRNFDNGAARNTILQIFEQLGGSGELVSKYRRMLAQTLH